MKKFLIVATAAAGLAVGGCNDPAGQDALAAGAVGAAGGAVLGAIAGDAALGAAVGGIAAGTTGYIYSNQSRNYR